MPNPARRFLRALFLVALAGLSPTFSMQTAHAAGAVVCESPFLADVFDRFCEYKNGEEALLICDLVKVQLLRNKGEDAYRTAASMMKLLEPLRADKVVSAAIAELLRSGKDGLTLALVERIQGKIEGELRASISRQ